MEKRLSCVRHMSRNILTFYTPDNKISKLMRHESQTLLNSEVINFISHPERLDWEIFLFYCVLLQGYCYYVHT